MEYNEQTEKIIIKALELLEKGEPIPKILNLLAPSGVEGFPENKNELEELFQTLTTVQTAKHAIHPPKKLLYKIISQIPDERTEHQENHSPSFGFAPWFKFAVPVAMIAVLVSVFYSKLLPEESQKTAELTTTPAPAVSAPAITDKEKNKTTSPSPEPTSLATDNLDALIDEAIALADNQQFAQNEDADASFINSDDQALDDLGQYYNEEEL
ncbi:MAG: hypothetical protein A2736_01210 [Candidatus Yanofskybacteria bacterium RIFCSPHIGHO2_01_FULL_41_27]|uniref:Uncharacterized protein n=4 Tax=Parcubacteria group TaxID=1794811 RepID=A0A0G1L017_9BACT|nr:MAG: hypothetical protein UU84_C0017G0006 [Candidatus Yanofskybacteria bacterium GW2011_GWC2_41_9]KKT61947.1 MAG: hypothetical protein UW55_C0020G0011 [Candidatus Giovannonibacteria bacterium GW2011_GWA2_44_26]KKU16391.1 MAG: hypothetical protein UX24_C0011G0016 [Candidatus Giovannonibacteria bacterium GW2011_GWB1_45_9b]OGM98850.1 MAG: hypothetical protein A2736_01210 [Candidatus Yanofskybacteria bacterium RIFCSPHIGHO2_01_FULL_41_27]OGN21424.1 MAG: hypothetical protein A3B00_00395 [Candidatu